MHCQFGSQHSTGFWESPLELVLEMFLFSFVDTLAMFNFLAFHHAYHHYTS